MNFNYAEIAMCIFMFLTSFRMILYYVGRSSDRSKKLNLEKAHQRRMLMLRYGQKSIEHKIPEEEVLYKWM